MKKSFIAVCAGAPLLVLGVGAPTAWAAPGDHGATVSINGDPDTKGQGPGTAQTTDSTGKRPNIAVAVNGDSFAAAVTGSGDFAVAVNGGQAISRGGSGNTSIAINDESSAQAGLNDPGLDDDDNTAIAINGSRAFAGVGDDNTAMAITSPGGDISLASAGGDFTDNNTAVDICGTPDGAVVAQGGDATVRFHGSGCG